MPGPIAVLQNRLLQKLSALKLIPMPSPAVRPITFGSADYHAALLLREAVLRSPLGLKLEDDDVQNDAKEWHFGAFMHEQIIACVILRPQENAVAKLRQMAVAPAYQGLGIGKTLVRCAESYAKEQGIQHIIMHARESAVPFYLALGYTSEGTLFDENTVPHIKMTRQL